MLKSYYHCQKYQEKYQENQPNPEMSFRFFLALVLNNIQPFFFVDQV